MWRSASLRLELLAGLQQFVHLLLDALLERLAAGAQFPEDALRGGQFALQRAGGLARAVQLGALLPELRAGLRQLVGQRLQRLSRARLRFLLTREAASSCCCNRAISSCARSRAAAAS